MKLIFKNKATSPLHISLESKNSEDAKLIVVNRKMVVKVPHDLVVVNMCYDDSNLEIVSDSLESKDVTEVNAFCNHKYKGKILSIHKEKHSVKITVTQKISIAEIVEG